MKKTTIILVAVICLAAGAGLLSKGAFQNKPMPLTYATGNPTERAELERLLKKHGVPFTHSSAEQSSSSSSSTTTSRDGTFTTNVAINFNPSLLPAVVIEDGSAPNAVAAMQEFNGWLSSHSGLSSSATPKE